MQGNTIVSVRQGAWWLAVGLMLASPAARAAGNYTHLWVAMDAVRYLPKGELRTLLDREDIRPILGNGANFPDGGYAVDDDYGETGHWEPFHLAYADWIRATFQPPWSDEAAQHIAFLMGMAAHGMADQLFDAMYLERHQHYDANGDEASPYGVDGATDSCFAARMGFLEPPEAWVPADELAPLFEPLLGHPVDPDTIRLGQTLVRFAVVHATTEAADPSVIATYLQTYPYACGHTDDPDVPGSPPTHGRAVAAYWQVLWARLHGDTAFDKPLLGIYFSGGSPWDYPRDATHPDSWVSFAMPRGLDPSTLTAGNFVVARDGGDVVPVKVNLYYRLHSHVINLKPIEDWPQDASFTVTIAPPLASWDLVPLERTYSFGFSTLPAPEGWGDEPGPADGPAEEVAGPVETAEVDGSADAVEVSEGPADAGGDGGLPADVPAVDPFDSGPADAPAEPAADTAGIPDAKDADAGTASRSGGGCAASAGPAGGFGLLPAAAFMLLLAAAARRAPRRGRPHRTRSILPRKGSVPGLPG